MFKFLGQEPGIVFSADTGAGGGGSTSGDGAGAPAGGGDAGSAGKSGGEGGAPGGQTVDDGGTGDAKGKSYDEGYVKQLREEAAKHRREKAEVEKRLKALEDEKLSDTEKREKRLKELEAENARLAGESRRTAILAQAAAAGAIVPEAIVGLVPSDAEDVKSAVAAIKRDYGDLFRKPTAGSADAGAATGGKEKQPFDMDTWIRRQAGRDL